jgi:hypothetical protein
VFGHWQDEDIPVACTLLTNGEESKLLVLSQDGSPLPTGRYTMTLVLDRDRWNASTAGDPEQHYHDERAIALQW